MTESSDSKSKPRLPPELAERARNARSGGGGRQPRAGSGPAPSRILAAAASVSAGFGLIALLGGSQGSSDVVIEVRPAPVVVESQTVTAPGVARSEAIPVVEGATPAPAPSGPGQAEPVARSEGS